YRVDGVDCFPFHVTAGTYPVDYRSYTKFFVIGTTFGIIHCIPVKRGGNYLLIGRIGKHIARKLFDGELIKRLVFIKTSDHIIAVSPYDPRRICLVPLGVGVPRKVKPPCGPFFAKMWR